VTASFAGLEASEPLRRSLLGLIESLDGESEGPLETTARLADAPLPRSGAPDVVLWIRDQVERLSDHDDFFGIEFVLAGDDRPGDR
jgi:hypothetical protein